MYLVIAWELLLSVRIYHYKHIIIRSKSLNTLFVVKDENATYMQTPGPG